jgi:hypothetical protein
MIGKILLTAAVIAAVVLFARSRSERRNAAPRRAPARLAAAPHTPAAERLPRYLAYALLLLMLGGSAVFVFLEWRDQYRVVTVRVVNTNTGSSVIYQARRGEVEDRSFETLDGRRIVLAAVERLELGSP